ncbi:hypothetical protein CHUAL_001120 [Chamberlinius hualienensis]
MKLLMVCLMVLTAVIFTYTVTQAADVGAVPGTDIIKEARGSWNMFDRMKEAFTKAFESVLPDGIRTLQTVFPVG